jgi:hypothetical protein
MSKGKAQKAILLFVLLLFAVLIDVYFIYPHLPIVISIALSIAEVLTFLKWASKLL